MKEKEEIGKRISKARKEKKMTQQELAEKLFVSDKAISNWETGKNLPDIEMIRKIENILEIKLLEKYYNRKKLVKRIFIATTFLLLLVVLCPLLIYFINNYNKVKIYELSLENNSFYLEYGNITLMNEMVIINLGSIKNKEFPYQPHYTITLYYQEENKKNEIITLDNYSTLYIKEEKNDYTLLNSEFLNNIEQLYLKINYINYEKEEQEENIKINIKQINNNKKIFYKEKVKKEEINVTLQNLLKNNKYHRTSKEIYEKKKENNYYKYDSIASTFYYYGIDNNIEYYAIKEKNKSYKYAIVKEDNVIEYKLTNGNKGTNYLSIIEEKLNETNKIEI